MRPFGERNGSPRPTRQTTLAPKTLTMTAKYVPPTRRIVNSAGEIAPPPASANLQRGKMTKPEASVVTMTSKYLNSSYNRMIAAKTARPPASDHQTTASATPVGNDEANADADPLRNNAAATATATAADDDASRTSTAGDCSCGSSSSMSEGEKTNV